jgi:uncharacterized protein (TIGR03435 family)
MTSKHPVRLLDAAGRKLLVAVCSAVAAFAMTMPQSFAQAPAPSQAAPTAAKQEFDVAAVHQNKAGISPSSRPQSNFPLGPGAMYSPNGGTFSATNQPLWVYIMFAYKMTDHEVESLRKQLPGWALNEQYDIQAKSENHEATKDDMRMMMRSLLADRFKLAIHTSTEQVSVYAMVLAKPGKLGPKLLPHPASDTSCSDAIPSNAPGSPPAPPTVAGGFPVICGGAAGVPPSVPGRLAVGYRNVPLPLIALQLTGIGGLDRPVIDQTGLTGNYDFLVEFSPELPPGVTPPANFDTAGPAFQQALMEQTGLKLVSQKGPVDVILIDHIDHLSEN